jgi:hypothetical protein
LIPYLPAGFSSFTTHGESGTRVQNLLKDSNMIDDKKTDLLGLFGLLLIIAIGVILKCMDVI